MQQYNEILKQQEIHHASKLLKKHGIICKQLKLGDDECDPLYLAKPHWTNRFDENRETTVGIFCAIWVGPSLLKQKKFAYNIHAMKLQKLPDYTLTPSVFASEFRSLVKSKVAKWPGISLKHGPSTLLQGKETSALDIFAEKVDERILGFVSLSQDIDDLLEQSLNGKN